jgi:hypothetical protein
MTNEDHGDFDEDQPINATPEKCMHLLSQSLFYLCFKQKIKTGFCLLKGKWSKAKRLATYKIKTL